MDIRYAIRLNFVHIDNMNVRYVIHTDFVYRRRRDRDSNVTVLIIRIYYVRFNITINKYNLSYYTQA